MAITVVSNLMWRKVFKPEAGRIEPKISGFTEFCVVYWMLQLAVPTLEASGWYGEAEGTAGLELDDAGLLKWLQVETETRPDAANAILALAGGWRMYLGDIHVAEGQFPAPDMYQPAIAAVQPYSYSNFYLPNLDIPMLEDDRLQPAIYGANVFGGADANCQVKITAGYIKTR